jgi:hypothetical protein
MSKAVLVAEPAGGERKMPPDALTWRCTECRGACCAKCSR